MSSPDIKRKTEYLLNLLEEIQKYRDKFLFPEKVEIVKEHNSNFHEVFDQLPYDEQLAFVALLAATEVIPMEHCEKLLERAEQNEQVRKIVEAFNTGYVGMTNPHTDYTPAQATALVWDSIVEENR